MLQALTIGLCQERHYEDGNDGRCIRDLYSKPYEPKCNHEALNEYEGFLDQDMGTPTCARSEGNKRETVLGGDVEERLRICSYSIMTCAGSRDLL